MIGIRDERANGFNSRTHGNSATPAATYIGSMAIAGDGTMGVIMVRRARPTTIARLATIKATTSTRTPTKPDVLLKRAGLTRFFPESGLARFPSPHQPITCAGMTGVA